jgi:hypothetical protein
VAGAAAATRSAWQVECVNSMIKRNLGSALRGRTRRTRQAHLRLKVLTHDVMILRRSRGSRQSKTVTYFRK